MIGFDCLAAKISESVYSKNDCPHQFCFLTILHTQLITLHLQISRLQSQLHAQLYTVNSQRFTLNYQLSTLNSQLISSFLSYTSQQYLPPGYFAIPKVPVPPVFLTAWEIFPWRFPVAAKPLSICPKQTMQLHSKR